MYVLMIYNQVFRFKICAGLPVATPEWEFKINANAFRIKKCLFMGCFVAKYYHISFGCQEHNPYCQHQLRGKGMLPSLPQDLSWPCCCQNAQVSGTRICWESRARRPGHGTYRREQQERKSKVMEWITLMLMWSLTPPLPWRMWWRHARWKRRSGWRQGRCWSLRWERQAQCPWVSWQPSRLQSLGWCEVRRDDVKYPDVTFMTNKVVSHVGSIVDTETHGDYKVDARHYVYG